MMARRFMMGRLMVVGGVLALLVASGCKDPNEGPMQAQAARITELQKENNDLRARLAAAMSERDAARARAQALEQQVRDLQGQLAQRPTSDLPPGWQREGPYTWTSLSTDFLFDSGKATLRPAARAKLQEVVATIQSQFPNDHIMVIGHTDTDPIRRTKDLWADNLDLSANRGMTVFRELMTSGIQPQRMVAGGQGEWFPVASNTSRAGKQQNRRVEIIAVPARSAVGTTAEGPSRVQDGAEMETPNQR